MLYLEIEALFIYLWLDFSSFTFSIKPRLEFQSNISLIVYIQIVYIQIQIIVIFF